MQPTLFIFLGGLLAALAVGLGAIGAHALKTHLAAEQLETFHTAVQYQICRQDSWRHGFQMFRR
jgi:uncharacterized membrane protein YgdD (TMEM256/DUF423 family)